MRQGLLRWVVLGMSLMFTMPCWADSEGVKRSYSDIQVEEDNKLVKRLVSKSRRKRERALEVFLKDPSSHNPSVLYAASHALFHSGDKNEASFWFYTGQIRARYDANRCLDLSARQAVSVLNNSFGPQINQIRLPGSGRLKEDGPSRTGVG